MKDNNGFNQKNGRVTPANNSSAPRANSAHGKRDTERVQTDRIVSPDSAFSHGPSHSDNAARGGHHQGDHSSSGSHSHHLNHSSHSLAGDGSNSHRYHGTSDGHHSSGHSSSRRRSYRKQYEFNAAFIAIVVSIIISIVIIVGVIINHNAKLEDLQDNELQTNDTGSSDPSDNSVSQTIEMYSLDSNEVIPGIVFPIVKVYDEKGNLIVSPVRQENGNIDGTMTYEYNSDGECIMEKLYGRDGRLTYKSVLGGTEDGISRTLYETEYDSKNNYTGYTETFFDQNGTVIGKIECSYNGVIEGKYDYEFDEQGRVLRENRYTPYGDLSVYTEYKYDSFGNNTECTQFDSSGKEVLRDVMKYDSENRIVLEEHYTMGVCKSYVEYTYDDLGNVSKRKFILKDEHTMSYEEVPG